MDTKPRPGRKFYYSSSPEHLYLITDVKITSFDGREMVCMKGLNFHCDWTPGWISTEQFVDMIEDEELAYTKDKPLIII
jgi:hypothetical protein